VSSTADRASSAFDRLSDPICRWVWEQGWTALREIQELAVEPILAGRSVVLASATASGKTEAAFMPLLSRPVRSAGLRILCVSPLKALINDQARRLESLTGAVGLTVTPWHGDVPAARKRRLRELPAGVLLITPESLEAMFVLHGSEVASFFGGLDYVVVDELHSFIATERGRQLQSLLRRVELAIGRGVPHVGLSATLGDLAGAAEFLAPGAEDRPDVIDSRAATREIRLQVRGYLNPPASEGDASEPEELVDDLYDVVRDGSHIVFANRRADVEEYVYRLKLRGEVDGGPSEFWAHHGSLAKDVRADAEAALRSTRPSTVVATTTLELGIDVGSVDTIVQIGAPPSVSSMRQRLGRSGRKSGDPSVLRIFLQEESLDVRTPPQDELRDSVVQSVAIVQLLTEGFNEAPHVGALHLSTLVQQVLSLVAQRGGFRAEDAWRALCALGPFVAVTADVFATLLRDLAEHGMLVQTHDGTILLGADGERLVNRYDFYSAFVTSEEYRLLFGSRTLGSVPVSRPLLAGDLLLFAGQRWRVLEVREIERVILLEPAPGGRAPRFSGGAALVDDAVRRRMREVYESADYGAYLSDGARVRLAEGREAYERLGLREHSVLTWGSIVLLFPWAGDRTLDTLALMLRREGMNEATRDGVAVVVPDVSAGEVQEALGRALANPPSALDLAANVANKKVEKHHDVLGEELLTADFASSRLDRNGALSAAASLLERDYNPL
jgi:ATP-dependent Lhr-like helicase